MNNYKLIYVSKNNRGLNDNLKLLSTKKIFFGHQSVGNNIIHGIDQIQSESEIKLNLIETRDIKSMEEPAFVHFPIGENKKPISKIDDFSKMIEQIGNDSSSIAFFKFCYIDLMRYSNSDSIFDYYKETILKLKDEYPKTKIILVTVPLRALQTGVKAFVKKMLLRPVGDALDNINRNKFNVRMKNELSTDFLIFDLATIEATMPDGNLNTYKHEGSNYPAMYKMYTYDGGHLNSLGARISAENLINFLAASN